MLRRKSRIIFYIILLLIFIIFVKYFTYKYSSSIKYAVISCSITGGTSDERKYCFYLPITILAWKRVGHESIVIISMLKNHELDERDLKVIEYVKYLNARLVIIEIENKNTDLIRLFSMISRLYIGSAEFLYDENFVITSDSDLIPLDESVYNFEDFDVINIFNAFCCDDFEFEKKMYHMYPIGNIGMKKKYWKQVMKLDDNFKFNEKLIFEDFGKMFRDTFHPKFSKLERGNDLWYCDQKLISVNIGDFIETNPNLLNEHDIETFRLDRSYPDFLWEQIDKTNLYQFADFHSFNEDIFNKWSYISKVLKIILPKNDFFLVQKYYREYRSLSMEVL